MGSGDYLIKLDGAQSHLDNLEREIDGWLRKDHYSILPPEQDPNGGPEDWQIRAVCDRPPFHWPRIIGDILHNLRGTLDHLVFSLSSSYSDHPLTKEITEQSEFPIYGDMRSEGVAAVEARYRNDIARKLAGVSPQAKTFIKSLQPYRAGNAYSSQPLWKIHELSNIDKHRLLLVCEFSSKSAILREHSDFDFTGGNAIYKARLKPDAVVVRFSGRPHYPGAKVDVQFSPLMEVIFDGVPTVDGEEVVETFQQLIDYVRCEVVTPLSKFL